ncbi:AmmeMemoRadiSam system protein B [candidate division KSB1 bacterium]|nr:AmmeMemoRadiSam system protein B [candidate division KSB1 bacterium]TDI85086.1 MAG: AmmeMemoRadiSam system protein B [Caldithrix sp.]
MRAVRSDEVRRSVVAGMFYPCEQEVLEQELDRLFDSVGECEAVGEIKALISPHAGYQYSGKIAAAGYKQLQNYDVSTIAIISPNHHEYFDGISVFAGKAYETPLGLLQVDQGLAEALVNYDDVIMSSWSGHLAEHAVEVQLPFLQRIFRDVKIIPIVMGRQDYEMSVLLGEALAHVLSSVPFLVIASSDLSHYHPYHEAIAIDSDTISTLEHLDETELIERIEAHQCEACGGGPIAAAMLAAKKAGANHTEVFAQCNSGDVSGDRSRVVGYVSAAFTRVPT